ncbi:DNA repair and recombination protein RAD54-like, partial [Hippocampus comes]
MRRSLAPSQVAKRKQADDEEDEEWTCAAGRKRSKRAEAQIRPSPMSTFRRPLTQLNARPVCPDGSKHEEFIRRILSKPFKVPIPNYT